MPTIPIDTNYTYLTQQQFFLYLAFSYWLKGRAVPTGTSVNTVLSVYNESREKEETSEGESYKGLREVELEIKALKNREGEVNQTALLSFDRWTGVIKNSSSHFK